MKAKNGIVERYKKERDVFCIFNPYLGIQNKFYIPRMQARWDLIYITSILFA